MSDNGAMCHGTLLMSANKALISVHVHSLVLMSALGALSQTPECSWLLMSIHEHS